MISTELLRHGLRRRRAMSIRPAELDDAPAISRLHAASFRRGWSDGEIEALMRQDNVQVLVADYRPVFGRGGAAGFVMLRLVDTEAEILTIAVDPAHRRRGIGRHLMEDALRHLYRERADHLFLEVDSTNDGAIALYKALDFVAVGERSGYYPQAASPARGALVMRRDIG